LLKQNVDLLAHFLTELFNRSLQGIVPLVFKTAYITPLLKKYDLDPDETKSYRPISNFLVLYKTLERVVARQLIDYLNAAEILPDVQSAYRAHHSTETAVLKVLADILRAVDSGELAALAMLDLSAAFDPLDNETLLTPLNKSYGLVGCAHDWFQSYLSGRFQSVRCGGSSSTPTLLICGVPQGSVLGPIRFLIYTADLLRLI
jgi:Reverse transcriptase (RNA-dependent DNA polymerase)